MTILVLFSPQRFVTPFWSFSQTVYQQNPQTQSHRPPTKPTNPSAIPITPQQTQTRNTNQNPQKSNTPTKNQIVYHQSKPKPTHYKTHHHSATAKRKREEKLQTHYHGAGLEQRRLKCRRTSPTLSGGEWNVTGLSLSIAGGFWNSHP